MSINPNEPFQTAATMEEVYRQRLIAQRLIDGESELSSETVQCQHCDEYFSIYLGD